MTGKNVKLYFRVLMVFILEWENRRLFSLFSFALAF